MSWLTTKLPRDPYALIYEDHDPRGLAESGIVGLGHGLLTGILGATAASLLASATYLIHGTEAFAVR